MPVGHGEIPGPAVGLSEEAFQDKLLHILIDIRQSTDALKETLAAVLAEGKLDFHVHIRRNEQ